MPDFFTNACKENPKNNVSYGICDLPGGKAFTTTDDQEEWGATVKNESKQSISFTAIYKCLFSDNDFSGRGRCDGMLTTNKHLFLIELKNRNPRGHGVNKEALEQLESTIKFLYEFHPDKITKFSHKKIFACNKKRPQFVVIDSELKRRFFDNYKFRVDIQANIVIF